MTNDKRNDCEQQEIKLNPVGISIQDVPIIYGPASNSATPFEPFNTIINYTSDSCDPDLSIEGIDINNNTIYPNTNYRCFSN